METYEVYKDSGFKWLGKIPINWRMESFKNILNERNEKNNPIKTDERLSLSIDKGVTSYIDKTTNLDRFKDDVSQYKLAHKGDLVFNSMNMIVGALGVSNYYGCVSPVYYTYYSKHNSTKFYEYFFRNKNIQGVLYSMSKGLLAIDRGDGKYNTLRLKVSRDDLRSFKIPLPPIQEQEAIANFLDEKTAKIDALVQTKEQQIEKLKELRQAKIHQAVTKGLDANAPTRESGVEWIGEIPEHWEVSSLKWYAKIYSGGTPDKSNLKYWENGTIPWLGSGEVNQEIVNTPTSYITEDGLYKSSAKWMMKDSLILALAGQGKTKGMVAYMNFNATGNQSLASINPNPKFYSKYLFFYLKASYRILRGEAGEGHRDGLNLQILGAHTVLIPPIQEQEQIVAFLDEVTGKIDQAIAQKQEQITKLKEYKQSLINDVVTGKVRVC